MNLIKFTLTQKTNFSLVGPSAGNARNLQQNPMRKIVGILGPRGRKGDKGDPGEKGDPGSGGTTTLEWNSTNW